MNEIEVICLISVICIYSIFRSFLHYGKQQGIFFIEPSTIIEQALGVGDGQGSLMCCSPRGHKELDMTE